MMNVHKPYCGSHFMMYTSQIIMFYTLNSYSAVCQLHFKETGKKPKPKKEVNNQCLQLKKKKMLKSIIAFLATLIKNKCVSGL